MAGQDRLARGRRGRRSRFGHPDDGRGLRAPSNNLIAGVDAGTNVPIQNISHETADLLTDPSANAEELLSHEHLPPLETGIPHRRRTNPKDAFSSTMRGSAPEHSSLSLEHVKPPPTPTQTAQRLKLPEGDLPSVPRPPGKFR